MAQGPADAPTTGRPRLLLVEDDALVRKMLGTFLEPRYAVSHAGNGRDALELLKSTDVDLVLTDVRMPVMDGIQLVRAIRRLKPHLPTVVMTGLGNEETAVEALRAGATNYLKKPFRNHELDHVVRKCLEVTQGLRNRMAAFSFLRESSRTFELPARLDHTRAVLPLLTDGLVDMGLIEAPDLLNLEVALEESLSNAVLHGALELTDAVKKNRSDREAFERAYRERIADPQYASRSVIVQTRVTPDQATFVIEDPGVGFDFASLPPPSQLSTLDGLQGRGLMLIRLFMDDVVHEANGRRIRMVKRASRGTASGSVPRPGSDRLRGTPPEPDPRSGSSTKIPKAAPSPPGGISTGTKRHAPPSPPSPG